MAKFIAKNGVITVADASNIDAIVEGMSALAPYQSEFSNEIVDTVKLGTSNSGNPTIEMKMKSGITAKTHPGAVMFALYPNFEERKSALVNGFDVVGELEDAKVSRTKTTLTVEGSGAKVEAPAQSARKSRAKAK